jgi:hypothetical protein
MKLCGITWQKTACIIHLKFRVEDIFVGGTTLGNKMGMLHAVAVIPYTLFLYSYAINYAELFIIKMLSLCLKHHHLCHHQLRF